MTYRATDSPRCGCLGSSRPLCRAETDGQVEARAGRARPRRRVRNDGFKVRDGHWTGSVKKGERAVVAVNLYAGNEYWFSVGGDRQSAESSRSAFTTKMASRSRPKSSPKSEKAAAGFSPTISGQYFVSIAADEGDTGTYLPRLFLQMKALTVHRSAPLCSRSASLRFRVAAPAATCSRSVTSAEGGKMYAVGVEKAAFYRYGPQQGNGPDEQLPTDTLVRLIRNSFGYSKVVIAESGQAGLRRERRSDRCVRRPDRGRNRDTAPAAEVASIDFVLRAAKTSTCNRSIRASCRRRKGCPRPICRRPRPSLAAAAVVAVDAAQFCSRIVAA